MQEGLDCMTSTGTGLLLVAEARAMPNVSMPKSLSRSLIRA